MPETAVFPDSEKKFWSGRRVFLTGHTGFKGAWLTRWLHSLGAEVTGYALEPPTEPSLFEQAGAEELLAGSHIADIMDLEELRDAMNEARPDIVIHMAAQSLVRTSYEAPVETFDVNVIGTVHLLEAVRSCPTVRSVVSVTSDKCYENREWERGYREDDPLGGYDPYSSSKACAELVTQAYRNSFFNPRDYKEHGVAVASVRAGNVIGGGDWATDRLIPDCVRAFLSGTEVVVRNPQAVRPWQHVLEPLRGYLMLAKRLHEDGPEYAGAWNFGPDLDDARPVQWIVEHLSAKWGEGASFSVAGNGGKQPHEAGLLRLDHSKAVERLGWRPAWTLARALDAIVEWTRVLQDGGDVREECLRQITVYSD
jgi:CDP-glucose 4,6-dehydratase